MDNPRTYWEAIVARAGATPDGPLTIEPDGTVMTFSGFRDAAERVAAGLATMGVAADTRVSWQLPNGRAALVLSAALARLGAVQNPIIPIYREREVGFVTRQTGARLLVVPSWWRGFDYRAMAESVAATTDNCEVLVCDGELPEGDPAALAPFEASPGADGRLPVRWIYYTSGTTADPKGAMHGDDSVIAAARHVWESLELGADDVWPLAFPFTHIGGISLLIATLVCGTPMLMVESFNPETDIHFFGEHGLTLAGSGTPFFIAYLTEQRKTPDRPIFPRMRAAIGGGAPKPAGLHMEVKNEMGGAGIISSYGLTECPIVTYARLDDPDDKLDATEGRIMEDTDWKLVDGELLLKGPTLCRGYLDEALNETAFDNDGFFFTGDLARVDGEGFVTIVGRKKDVIIRKGENISAKEVEDVLFSHPGVADVAVIGLADPVSGERCCAVVVPRSGEPFGFAGMVEHCKEAGLMNQKIPEQLEIVGELPRNPAGKVLKQQLRETYGQ
ncbi:AMP-binding protein [Candidatus Poriferisocius sp.]|uniref:AMP-binding protein n=1 Tax=Candidatus Poriferisocius sp. TaxID=3101276 RepID=UPI003B01D4FE